MTGWHEALLDFWFGIDTARHWQADPILDAEISARFGRLWEDQRGQPLERFLGAADLALAGVILFDQFPRNMFRGGRRAFATDPQARDLAEAAVARGLDVEVPLERRLFFYLPFEHSERLEDQDRAVRLIAALGRADWADFAVKHRDVIAQFGRFPHRNAVLGRESSEQERAFGLEPAW